MIFIKDLNLPLTGEILEIAPIIEGSEAFLLSELINKIPQNIIYITEDEQKLTNLINSLQYFKIDKNLINLLEWDCSPYEQNSPTGSVAISRINSLIELITVKKPKLLLVSINSLIQRIIPKDFLLSYTKKISRNDQINYSQLINFLISSGFNRTSVASEPGEFALRGSIIDIFAKQAEFGWRLDFFGDKIESIRIYNPISQISGGQLESIVISPASEVILDKETVENFRHNYLKIFGVHKNEPLYEAVLQYQKFPAIEHKLALFYQKLENIFDYIEAPFIILDPDVLIKIEQKLINIAENYLARKNNKFSSFEEYPSNPLVPASLYLTFEEIKAYFKNSQVIQFSHFINEAKNSIKLELGPVEDFSQESKIFNKSAIELFKEFLKNNASIKSRFLIASQSPKSRERLQHILSNYDLHIYSLNEWNMLNKVSKKTIGLIPISLNSGFRIKDLYIFSEADLLGPKLNTIKNKKKVDNFLIEASNLNQGELIVHRQHGIGRFDGLTIIKVANIEHDCLQISYAAGDKLYIPVENIEIISKYGSSEIELDKLGGSSWQNRKAKLKNRIKDSAAELLKIAAARKLKVAPLLATNSKSYDEFCNYFPYIETEDQLIAIEEVKKDLASGQVMDRLICGDVGFGKTEVALRATAITVLGSSLDQLETVKHQVAIIAPTTLLVKQHYNNFIKRFSNFDVKIAQLSRLVTSKEAKEIKEKLAEGKIDIIIATHTLFAKDINFSNLSLLIIDEEQHFGVSQKEKIKQLKSNVHVLSLSATPIPRTLQMSLAGIKELSLIATPPIDRLVVKTTILAFDSILIREAILKEYYRGGQIFYICPKISDLSDLEQTLKTLVPEVNIRIAHGKLTPNKLEAIIDDFYHHKFDLLLSTTIVESGLDITRANTIFIHKADTLGLAQLYQLRGRVGRGKIKAYAYLLTSSRKILSVIAIKRLKVMQNLDSLGAGFSIASHDMDIRGFGNLVGDEQSGHIKEVGVELYHDLLKEALAKLMHNQTEEEISNLDYSPQLNLGLSIMIPESYINDLTLRLGLYRRIALLIDDQDVNNFIAELNDRFGLVPIEVQNLLETVKIKQLCKELNINRIDTGPKALVISFYNNQCKNSERLLELVLNNEQMKLRADQKLVIFADYSDPNLRTKYLISQLNKLLIVIKTPK